VLCKCKHLRNPVFSIVIRLDRSRFRKVVMKYQPAGKLGSGRPLKGCLGSYLENGTGDEAKVR
jgi:hypothetical protein